MIFFKLIFIGILSFKSFPQRDILKMSDFKDNRFLKMQVNVAYTIENKFCVCKNIITIIKLKYEFDYFISF